MLKKLLLAVLALAVILGAGLWIGSVASLDHDRRHAAATAQLPAFDTAAAASEAPTLSRIAARDMIFRARAAGFGGTSGNVLLLHGFPETSVMYEPLLPVLANAGYQVLAYDQRGYSPGARPADVAAYATSELVADVFAVADAVGFDTFHLVGHDWGAAVGWELVMADAERVQSWTSLSIPHLVAYGEAMQTDPDQQDRSAYIGFFQLPWLPETLLTFNGLNMLRTGVYADHPPSVLAEYLDVFAEPGALRAALNWYRAGGLDQPRGADAPDPILKLPVLFVWGTEDPVVGDKALALQRNYFEGPFREVPLETGHWLLQTEPQAVTAAVLQHLQHRAP